ncbi:MAG: FkbM family methyltransferase [Candidatus Peregrinibacteria bacterium]
MKEMRLFSSAYALLKEFLMVMRTAELYARCYCSTLFRPKEFHYVIGGNDFLVRKNASDMLTLREVWSHHVYLDPPANGIVVDIGANIGAFTVLAAQRSKRVIAFEPLQETARILKQNTRNLRNVSIFPFAIAGSEGTRTLSFGRHKPGKASIVLRRGPEQENIRTIALQQVFDLCGVSRIDLLKIDVEGAEYEILLSSPPEVLRRINAITMEFHDFLPPQHHSTLVHLLQKEGFAVTVLPFHYWLTRVGYLHAARAGTCPRDTPTRTPPDRERQK